MSGAAIVLASGLVATAPVQAEIGSRATAGTPEAVPAPGEQSTEIIVTAQRREQRLQDVPISITALTATQLGGQGITSTHDISQAVTGLTITESGGYVQPFIRGVGSTVTNVGEQGSAATYIDGVYMPIVGGQLYDLANVESIQVLKGPQGTLFGRNANSGAIIITTRQPSFTPTGSASLSFGNYNSLKTAGFVAGPITDTIAASLSGNYDSHDGFFHNLNPANGFGNRVGDGKRYTVRGSLLFQPSTKFKITLTGDGMNANDPSPILIQPINGYQGYLPGALIPKGPYDFIGGDHTRYLNGQWGLAGRVDWDLGGVRIESTTAYRHYVNSSYSYDSDTTPARLSSISDRDIGDSYTQEVLLHSNGKGAFNWVVGGFYLRQDAYSAPLRVDSGATSTLITVQQKLDTFAFFGDGTYTLGDFELTGGVRYSKDKKSYDGQLNGAARVTGANKSWDAVTPRAVIAYHPSHEVMLYGSFSKGFKAGTFNSNGLSPTPINPEKVDAFEAGFKLSPTPAVTINGAGFYYKTTDLQVQALNPANNLITIINAAKVDSKGADLDVSWRPLRDLDLKLGVSYLEAKFTSFPNAQVYLPVPGGDGRNASTIVDVTGKRNVRSPDWTVNFAADYKARLDDGGSIVPSFNIYYSSKFFWTVDNRISEPSHVVINANLTWNLPGDHFSVGLFGRNVTNEVRFRNVSAASAGGSPCRRRAGDVRWPRRL